MAPEQVKAAGLPRRSAHRAAFIGRCSPGGFKTNAFLRELKMAHSKRQRRLRSMTDIRHRTHTLHIAHTQHNPSVQIDQYMSSIRDNSQQVIAPKGSSGYVVLKPGTWLEIGAHESRSVRGLHSPAHSTKHNSH